MSDKNQQNTRTARTSSQQLLLVARIASTSNRRTERRPSRGSASNLLIGYLSVLMLMYCCFHSATYVSCAPTKQLVEQPNQLVLLLSSGSSIEQAEQQPTDSIIILSQQQQQLHQPRTGQEMAARRLIKRSGISDQRLAEIQMIRALKKQLEQAAKLAASNSNFAPQDSEPTT